MNPLNRKRHVTTGTDESPADAAGLSSVLGPAGVVNLPRHVQVGDGYASTLIVTGYPAEVGAAWLDPLLAWPGRVDVVVYIDPLTPTGRGRAATSAAGEAGIQPPYRHRQGSAARPGR